MVEGAMSLSRDFSKVVITLHNVLVPSEKLSVTPSMLDGLEKETETDLRVLGCELIQTAGILLKVPQVVAMACMTLASKIEESPRRIRDVINVFHHIKQVRTQRNIHPLVLDQNYINLKNQVIKAERRLLKELGFCVHVKHPHKIVVAYLRVLNCVNNRKLLQSAWNFMNDILRTDVFVRYSPESIACACIFLSARTLQIPLPCKPAWYCLFGVDIQSIEQICLILLHMYSMAKPVYDRLEKAVEVLKREQALAKMKAKAKVACDFPLPTTQMSSSRISSPTVPANPSSSSSSTKSKLVNAFTLENGLPNNYNRQPRKRRSSSDRRPRGRHPSLSRSRSSSRSASPLSPIIKRKKRSRSPARPNRKHSGGGSGGGGGEENRSCAKQKRAHKHKKRLHARSVSGSPSALSQHRSSRPAKKYSRDKRRSYSPDAVLKEEGGDSPPEKNRHSRKHRNGQRADDFHQHYNYYR